MRRATRPFLPAPGVAPVVAVVVAPVVAVVVAVVAVVLVVMVVAGAAPGPARHADDVPLGGVLSDRDRADLGATPVQRGADPPPADPTVDRTDPSAVARAYLASAYSLGPADGGATQRRGSPYAEPGSAAAAVGVVVLDPPPAGALRTATVTGLELVAVSETGDRRGYRAELGTATGPPGAPVTVTFVQLDVVVAREPDGRWSVTSDSADLPAGED